MSRCSNRTLRSVIFLCALTLFATPLWADHETIDMSAGSDLSTLITAINNNLGPDQGGFILQDNTGELGVQDCPHFVNGYDIDVGYVFYDFKDAQGDVTTNVTLYTGWDLAGAGIVGDSDGNGNPTTVGANPPCQATDLAGISFAAEFYEIRLLDCQTGAILARLGVTGDAVKNMDTFVDIPGATFAISSEAAGGFGGQIKARIPDLLSLLGSDVDACNLGIQLRAGSSLETLGEDATQGTADLSVPPSVAVTKTPANQTVCAGSPASWQITVTNDGPSNVIDFLVADNFDPAFFDVPGVSWDCAITGDEIGRAHV